MAKRIVGDLFHHTCTLQVLVNPIVSIIPSLLIPPIIPISKSHIVDGCSSRKLHMSCTCIYIYNFIFWQEITTLSHVLLQFYNLSPEPIPGFAQDPFSHHFIHHSGKYAFYLWYLSANPAKTGAKQSHRNSRVCFQTVARWLVCPRWAVSTLKQSHRCCGSGRISRTRWG